MRRILQFVVLIALNVALFYSLVLFAPLGFSETPRYGTTVTTIQGSDTLSSSRTTINNNFSALNAGKIENSTTSLPLLTTLANLATVGTITSGTWQATAITAAFGGTGSTTLSSNQILLGNGTGILKTVNGFGTSGQFLSSNGAGLAPSWTSATVDQTQAFSWTGLHTFSTRTVQATSTIGSLVAGTVIATSSLTVSGTASTSALIISTSCTGCLSGYETVSKTFAGPTAAGGNAADNVSCSSGKRVVGGGADNTVGGYITLYRSQPATTSWTVGFSCTNTGGCSANTATVYAVCVNP